MSFSRKKVFLLHNKYWIISTVREELHKLYGGQFY